MSEFGELAANLPQESQTVRALDEDWWVTPQVRMLQRVEHALQILAWQQTADGAKSNPKHYPQMPPVTRSEAAAATPDKYDLMTIAEVDSWLGEDFTSRK